MRTVLSEAQAIIDYVPTTSMEWGELWSEQIADERFCEVLTGNMPSTEWKTALWCESYMDAVSVKKALIDFWTYHRGDGFESQVVICTDEVSGFVVLTMEKDVR